jgi:SAM-dependent methyltransferase
MSSHGPVEAILQTSIMPNGCFLAVRSKLYFCKESVVPIKSIATSPRTIRPDKENAELAYWSRTFEREGGALWNGHYSYFYTELFGFTPQDYSGLRVLDVGCGPRGSLEWADMTLERVGIDPLVNKYEAFGIGRHKMTYVHAAIEATPFSNSYFDVIASFNSLDHVDDIDAALTEIKRLLKTGGSFLLITEVNHAARVTEPIEMTEDELKRKLKADFSLQTWRRYRIRADHDIYRSVRDGTPSSSLQPETPGIVAALAYKKV